MSDPLDEMIAACDLSSLDEDVASRAEASFAEALRATARAGTSPDGKPWPPTVEGRRALPDAAAAIVVQRDGAQLTASIGPPYSYQKRQILPEGTTPRISAVLTESAEAEWGGGR